MRNIKVNQMYKHYKGNRYFTLAISEPSSSTMLISKVTFIKATHVKTDKEFDILINLDTGKAIHNSESINKKLVIYRNAYKNNGIIWAMDYDTFIERIDTTKYPDMENEYIFTEVIVKEIK